MNISWNEDSILGLLVSSGDANGSCDDFSSLENINIVTGGGGSQVSDLYISQVLEIESMDNQLNFDKV